MHGTLTYEVDPESTRALFDRVIGAQPPVPTFIVTAEIVVKGRRKRLRVTYRDVSFRANPSGHGVVLDGTIVSTERTSLRAEAARERRTRTALRRLKRRAARGMRRRATASGGVRLVPWAEQTSAAMTESLASFMGRLGKLDSYRSSSLPPPWGPDELATARLRIFPDAETAMMATDGGDGEGEIASLRIAPLRITGRDIVIRGVVATVVK